MNRIDYALGVLDNVCRRFDEKYKGKVPYFVIYAFPVDNTHWANVRARSKEIRDRENNPQPKQSQSKSIKSQAKQGIINVKNPEEVTNFKGIKTTESTDIITTTVNGVTSRKKCKTQVQTEVVTFNYYDVIAPIYGEVHELEEPPTTDPIPVKIGNKLVVVKKPSKPRDLDDSNDFLGFEDNKEVSAADPPDSVVKKTTVMDPWGFGIESEVTPYCPKPTSIREHNMPSLEIMSLNHPDIRISEAVSQTRREIEESFQRKGLLVQISKRNDVEILSSVEEVRTSIGELGKHLKFKEVSDDEFSGDEFEEDSDL